MSYISLKKLPNYNKWKDSVLFNVPYVTQISKPIVNFFGAAGFSFMRLYKDGSRIWFSTSENWIEYFFNNEYFRCSGYKKFSSINVMLWKHWPKQDAAYHKLISEAREYFNFGNTITYNVKHDKYIDSLSIRGYANDEEINSKYLCNFSYIEKFYNYFLLNSDQVIYKAYKINIPEPNKLVLHNNNQDPDFNLVDNKYKNLFIDERNLPLSTRETECIYLLVLGQTIKEIAHKLGVSPRTVETHINNIKSKLNCCSKSQIVSKIYSNKTNQKLIMNFYLLKDF